MIGELFFCLKLFFTYVVGVSGEFSSFGSVVNIGFVICMSLLCLYLFVVSMMCGVVKFFCMNFFRVLFVM